MSEQEMLYCEKHDKHYPKPVDPTKVFAGCLDCQAEALEKPRDKRVQERDYVQSQNAVAKIRYAFMNSGIPPRYTTRTTENYKVLSRDHETALAKVKQYIADIDSVIEEGSSMIIVGGVGTGKTHLASAIGNAFISKNKTVAFMTVSAMFRFIRESYRRDAKHTEKELIEFLRKVDLLILDEICVQKGTESEEFLLFEVLNERYGYFKPTILISNSNISGVKSYIGDRSMDRITEGRGKLVVCNWESYRSQSSKDKDLPTLSGSIYTDDDESKE